MDFTGKFQLQSCENFVPFMKVIGAPSDLIEKGQDLKSTCEIEQNGKSFKICMSSGNKVIQQNFIVGEETELETLTGEKIKTTVNMEGNKLITNLKSVTSIIEVSGDTLINTLKAGDVVCKRISKRI